MLFNPSIPITDMQGEQLEFPIMDQVTQKVKRVNKITCGFLCSDALVGTSPDSKEVSVKESIERFALASEIIAAEKALKQINIDAKDVTLILETIAKKWAPMVVGQMAAILDPKPKLVENKETA